MNDLPHRVTVLAGTSSLSQSPVHKAKLHDRLSHMEGRREMLQQEGIGVLLNSKLYFL